MSFLGGLFGGGKNPADAGMGYLNQIPGKTQQYYQPYFDAGKSQLPGLQEQYGQLMNDPGGRMNQIGESFHESPGFQFALQQALGAGNRSAAAGGMAGSPANMQGNMQLATNMGNQEYNNWLQNAMGMYGMGMQGSQGMANMGQQAGNSMADMIAQTLAQQGNMAFRGQQEQNSNRNSLLGGLGNLAGAAFGAFNPWQHSGSNWHDPG
jgi:hypothetical protein